MRRPGENRTPFIIAALCLVFLFLYISSSYSTTQPAPPPEAKPHKQDIELNPKVHNNNDADDYTDGDVDDPRLKDDEDNEDNQQTMTCKSADCPWLSVTQVMRNDDYLGNALLRYQRHVDNIAYYANKHKVNVEIVTVEWNPPANKPRLKDVIKWPKEMPLVRIVTVPESLHKTWQNSDKIPVFEYIGKNVGMRRARGSWLIVTNPDDVFSEAFFEFLGDGSKLNNTHFYRIARSESSWSAPETVGTDQLIAELKKHTSKVLGYANHEPPSDDFWRREREAAATNAKGPFLGWSGDFVMLPTIRAKGFRGNREKPTHAHWDSYFMCKCAGDGLIQDILSTPIEMYHQWHHALAEGRPVTNWDTDVGPQCKQMEETGVPLLDNNYKWGYGWERLEETIIKNGEIVGTVYPDYSKLASEDCTM